MFQSERLNKRDWLLVAGAWILMAAVAAAWVYWIVH